MGETRACLKEVGKTPEESDRFISDERGAERMSAQDLRREVGIGSRRQVALEESRISLWISEAVVGKNSFRVGGERGDVVNGSDRAVGRFEAREVILSIKNFEKRVVISASEE